MHQERTSSFLTCNLHVDDRGHTFKKNGWLDGNIPKDGLDINNKIAACRC